MSVCASPVCDLSAVHAGYCNGHYQRVRAGKSVDTPIKKRNTGPCSVDGCETASRSLGLCPTHYSRHQVGQPLELPVGSLRKVPRPERRTGFTVDPVTGCHLTDGYLGEDGYPRPATYYHPVTGEPYTTSRHRVVYLETYGPESIPDGWEVDHRCRNRACINPAHLEAVTHQVNCQRGKGSITHCKHGHEFTAANTYVNPRTGGRTCRTCQREAGQRFRDRAATMA